MSVIYCIMGRSGSGKDTLSRWIKNKQSMYRQPINEIIMHTTRVKRENESDGNPMYFHTYQEYVEMLDNDMILEHRSYNTANGEQIYFVPKMELEKDTNYFISSGTVNGALAMQEYFVHDTVIPIYIDVSDRILLNRMLARECSGVASSESLFDSFWTPGDDLGKNNYTEVCRRFLADKYDYSMERLSTLSNLKIINGCKRQFEVWRQWFYIYDPKSALTEDRVRRLAFSREVEINPL